LSLTRPLEIPRFHHNPSLSPPRVQGMISSFFLGID
jgi:hypothetical protein